MANTPRPVSVDTFTSARLQVGAFHLGKRRLYANTLSTVPFRCFLSEDKRESAEAYHIRNYILRGPHH